MRVLHDDERGVTRGRRPISLLVLGAAVVFTSIVSGLTYVLRWSTRAWRVAHGAG